MRATTIIKRCEEINSLTDQHFATEEESEREYGFVTQKHQKKSDALSAKALKLMDKTIAQMHSAGYCSEDGLTSEEADSLIERIPQLRDCDCLFEVGDGNWC